MVSSQAWLFSVQFMCGRVLWSWDTLQTQPNILYPRSAQLGVGMGSSVVLWDHFWHMLAGMVSLESSFSTLKVNCMKLFFCYSGATAPLSLVIYSLYHWQHRTEKMTCLRWSCDKRWPNWDSRHHLCKTGMFLWKVATETIFALKTSRTWILAPKRIIWEGCCRCAWNPMGSSHTHDQFCLEFR